MGRSSNPPPPAGGIGTSQAVPTRLPRECAAEAKRALRMALDLAGMSVADFAEAIGEHDSTVEAWVNDATRNHVPMWVLSHPRCPAKVRAHLDAVHAKAAGTRSPMGAHTAEAQANVVTGGVGMLLAKVGAHMRDGQIDAGEAHDQLADVRALRDALAAYERTLLDVVTPSGVVS